MAVRHRRQLWDIHQLEAIRLDLKQKTGERRTPYSTE